jgi:hypothetical protein
VELILVHSLARFALWLVAALFAMAMALAPASAHPGHHDDGARSAAAHRHVEATPETASLNAIGLVSADRATATMSPSAPEDGCPGGAACHHGANCCGTGCCSAFIAAVAATLPLALPVALTRTVRTFESRTSVEPASLLEPPNFRA